MVPVLALDTVTSGLLSHVAGNNYNIKICKELSNFDPELGKNVKTFQQEPLLLVLGCAASEVLETWVARYYASKALV
jgi:hypothetical protein